jgi:type IV pilus assembly protein PilF
VLLVARWEVVLKRLMRRVLPVVLAGAGLWLPGTAAWAQSDNAPRNASGARADVVTESDETPAAKRARIRLELASAYFSQGQVTTALDEVKRALVADPENVGAFNLRGLIYANLGEHGLAEESFRRALQLRSDDPDTLHNFGWYLCQQRRFPEARGYFEAAMRVPRYRDAPKTWLAQGICEARAGSLDTAERFLLRSYELDPGNPATAVNLAEVLLKRNDLDRALFYVQRVNQRAELANAETLWLAARIEHRRGAQASVETLGMQLRSRYPRSREATAFEQGKFDE